MKTHSLTRWSRSLAGICLLWAVCSCETINVLTEVGTGVAVQSGKLTPEQATSINRSTQAVTKTFEQITPEQEYYIGRSVMANILARYPADYTSTPTWYLNQMGQSLAQFSERPETFAGYRFIILDSNDINAFAAPGGLIAVTKGLLRCCRSEDELAAVLAHEVAHAAKQHGLRAIKSSRLNSALLTLSMESAKQLGGAELAELTKTFEASITDITSTLMNNGYSRNLEFEADAVAIEILRHSGYAPAALISMLQNMQNNLVSGRRDFASTHPSPQDRIARIQKTLPRGQSAAIPSQRHARFQQFLKAL